MTIASNVPSSIEAFLAQLPPTVLVEQQGEVYCVQPQTEDALQAVLLQLSHPEFVSIKIAQTALDAECLEQTNTLWLDTTVATASRYTHKPKDFVVTVGVGKTLTALEAQLRRENQTLAFTPAYSGNRSVTIGQLLAENALPLEANIRRSTLNELVLGCSAFNPEMAEVVSFGGEVVKNVTGYDVQKFLVGHHYALGVVSRVTLRTTPLLPVRGVYQGVFKTEDELFSCLQACLTKPSLWMTHVLVKPHPEGFALSVGVEAPSAGLLASWQALYFPDSSFKAEGSSAFALQQQEPCLVLEIALPMGRKGWQQILHQLLPLLKPDEWQWLPACGVVQVFYHQTPPPIALFEQVAIQVASGGGSFRLIHAVAPLKVWVEGLYRLQWQAMPTVLQRQHHQLKQQLDPHHQFSSLFYPTHVEKGLT